MHVARLLFELASRESTGTVVVKFEAGGEARVEIERGWIYAVSLSPRPVRGEDALRRLLERAATGARFLAGEPPMRIGRYSPFHPAVLLRNHVEAALGPEAGPELRARAGDHPLGLAYPPHASCLGRDERPLVTLLGARRTVAELDAARIAAPARVERLLAFLHAVGSLSGELAPSAFGELELPDDAPADEIRRAYKRLARAVHPDLHPDASTDEKRELEARFARLNAAYRKLLPAD